MAVTSGLEPSTLLLMKLSSEVLEARDVIARQRKQLAAMAGVLRVQQLANTSLIDLVDTLLAEPGDDG
jgi:hypothetical protein